MVQQRRICWPTPDATCLEGGCGYCNNFPFKNVSVIENYAKKAGVLPNRGIGEQDALEAFKYGLNAGWNNAESREK